MKVGQTGITRQGLRAKVIEVMGSFAVVKTDTGTRYTMHEFELWPDDVQAAGPARMPSPAHIDAFHNWPRHNFHLRLVGEGSGKAKSLMVTGDDKAPPVRGQAVRFTHVRAVKGG